MAERSTKVVSVSLSPESAAAFDRLSAAEGRNRSELFREMLRVYEAYREAGRSRHCRATAPVARGPQASPPRTTCSG
jgi:metal-responsive CopG/Arc/MetJ family transcriptional regulator